MNRTLCTGPKLIYRTRLSQWEWWWWTGLSACHYLMVRISFSFERIRPKRETILVINKMEYENSGHDPPESKINPLMNWILNQNNVDSLISRYSIDSRPMIWTIATAGWYINLGNPNNSHDCNYMKNIGHLWFFLNMNMGGCKLNQKEVW